MSSKSRIPYFYIIQHTTSGKLYAGCKFSQDANPNTFLTKNGYKTSSNLVKSMIEIDGLESFKIIQMMHEEHCGIPVLEYETYFLQKYKIAERDNWLNFHNNDLFSSPFGSDEFKENMMRKFGVDNIMKLPWFVELTRKRYFEIHGVDSNFKNPDVKEIIKKTNIERYGVSSPAKNTDILNKMKSTCLDRYGEDNIYKTKLFQEIKSKTNLERYGVEYYTQTVEYLEKSTQTNLEKYGVPNHSQTEEFRKFTSDLHRDTEYWNNGFICLKFKAGDKIPEDFVHGMLPDNGNKDKRVINNGLIQTSIHPNETLPDGWSYGALSKGKFKIINNGIEQKRLYNDKLMPEGWSYGRIPKNK